LKKQKILLSYKLRKWKIQSAEESISEEAFILSLTTESPTTQCEDLEPSYEEPEGGVKNILD